MLLSSSGSSSCQGRGLCSDLQLPKRSATCANITRVLCHGPAAARQRLRLPAAAAASTQGDSSVDSVLESLREAFGAAPVAHRPQQQVEAPIPATPAASTPRTQGKPQRARSTTSRQRGSALGAPAGTTAGAVSPGTAAAAAADSLLSSPKKRRGRFGELILSLEHDQLYPQEDSSDGKSTSTSSSSTAGAISALSSSSTSTSSTSTSSSTAGAISALSSSKAEGSPVAAPAVTANSPVRRIRRVKPQADNQQQLQGPPALATQQHKRSQPKQQQQPQQQQQQQELPPWLQQQQRDDASTRRVKSYKPVSKGDLLLPGGPSWSGLRRHVVAAGSDPHLPHLDCIVIVEGDKDQQAVSRAVNAPVRGGHTGGGTGRKGARRERERKVAWWNGVVVSSFAVGVL